MRVEIVPQALKAPQATFAVYGEGAFAEGIGALLSARNHRVLALSARQSIQKRYDLHLENRARYTNSYTMSAADLSHATGTDAVIVAVPATKYGAAFKQLAPHLNSGQAVFIAGAAFGAALQAETIIAGLRKDLSLSIVEVSRPFQKVEVDNSSVHITGVKEAILIAGCSLNATRNALSAGGGICSGLVPASNILERGFSDMERWLCTAMMLFSTFNSRPNEALGTVMLSFKNELQALAKSYGVNRLPAVELNRIIAATNVAPGELSERISEDFVILSGLARLKYLPCPVLDAVIDLGAVVTGCDLRKQARQLSDLGLIGMDAHEIIEHVSA